MILLELEEVSLSYGGRVLLDGVGAAFYDDRKVAFIGVNGAGKSTLCRIITGEEEPDSGKVTRYPALRMGYLRQNDPFQSGESGLAFLMRDSGKPDWRCAEMAGQFDIDNDLLQGPVSAMSGGWQTRLKLAALLLHEPNFLVLDEPTNFLDIRTQLLLQRFLRGWRGGALIVSHDRCFLNQTCDHTLELAGGGTFCAPGNVEDFLRQRELRLEQQRRENTANEARMRQLQRFIDKNRAGANTAAQARNKQKQLDRIELHEITAGPQAFRLRLPEAAPLRTTVLECDELRIGYGEHTVAAKINLSLAPGTRLAIAGDNGQGKTTLLRTLTGSLPPLGGKIRWAHNSQPCVYAQHVFSALPQDLRVREYLQSVAPPQVTEKQVLNVAGGFRFSGEDADKQVRVLSGGERARLCLAGLFLKGGNVLVLDEPVNHLDVETVEALAQALREYAGTVIFVSHDREFCRAVATEVVEIRGGRARKFPGDFLAYLESLEGELTQAAGGNPGQGGDGGNRSLSQQKEDARRRYQIEKRIGNLEQQMQRLDGRLAPLREEIHRAHDWQEAQRIQDEINALEDQKMVLEEEWLARQTEIEALS